MVNKTTKCVVYLLNVALINVNATKQLKKISNLSWRVRRTNNNNNNKLSAKGRWTKSGGRLTLILLPSNHLSAASIFLLWSHLSLCYHFAAYWHFATTHNVWFISALIHCSTLPDKHHRHTHEHMCARVRTYTKTGILLISVTDTSL